MRSRVRCRRLAALSRAKVSIAVHSVEGEDTKVLEEREHHTRPCEFRADLTYTSSLKVIKVLALELDEQCEPVHALPCPALPCFTERQRHCHRRRWA